MQHALLAFALALIFAIVAAIAAPLFVDWNDWRASFEARATQLAGAPVRIRGNIDATILPTPSFVLREVEIADPEQSTGLSAGEVRGVLSLGALLRGRIEAEEFRLAQANLRLVLEGDGTLPQAAGARAAAVALSVFRRFDIEQGSLLIEDRASGEFMIFDEIRARGEIHSEQGPLRLDGSLRRDGRRWAVRANAGVFGENGEGRVRLAIERPDDATLFDADGMLTVGGAASRFAGKIALGRQTPDGLPWKLEAQALATQSEVVLDSLELALGADPMPSELAGTVRFDPRRGGTIDGALSVRRLDLDGALGGEAAEGLPAMLAAMRETAALFGGIPFAGRLGVSVEAVMAGGAMVRDLRADLGLRDGSLVLEQLQARVPGGGSVLAAGSGADPAAFSGDIKIQAEDGGELVRWALGESVASAVEHGAPLYLAGKANWSAQGFAVDQLEFSVGEARLGGRFAFAPGDVGRPTQIDTHLTADGIDLDLLAPLAEALWSGSESLELKLAFSGQKLRVLGHDLERIEASVLRAAGEITVERLNLDDFDGLSAEAHGRIAGPADRPEGQIEFTVEAARPGGLEALTRVLAGEDAGFVMQRIAAAGMPIRLSGAAAGQGAAAGVSFTARGRFGDVEAEIEANVDTQRDALAEAWVTLNARDARRIVSLFGLPAGTQAAGAGKLEIIASAMADDELPLRLQFAAPGTMLSAQGVLRVNEVWRIEPDFQLQIETSDLRPLSAVAERAVNDALPVRASTHLTRGERGFRFANLSAGIGDVSLRGEFAVRGAGKPELSGSLALDRAELAGLLGLALGHAQGSGGFWPDAALAAAPLQGATGAIDFKVEDLGLAGHLAASGTGFRLTFGADGATIRNFTGTLAGGKLEGNARFLRGGGGPLSLDAQIKVSSFEIGHLFATGAADAPVRASATLALQFAGNGDSPAALAASLAGQGTIALTGLEIDGLGPGAVMDVFTAAAQKGPSDEVGVIAALSPALAEGTLHIKDLDAPLIAAGGVVRASRVRASAGAADVNVEASFDVARLRVDAAIELLAPVQQDLAVRPAATVRWQGPLAAPERGIEAAALANAINLRVMQREQQRLEEEERRAPDRAGQVWPSDASSEPNPPTGSLPQSVTSVPQPPERPDKGEAPPFTIALPPLAPPMEIGPAPGAR